MRIFDMEDNELQEDEIDYEAGYLEEDSIFKEHHDAVEAKEQIEHYSVRTFYFEDGSSYKPESEDDPHIGIDDAQKGLFRYVAQEGEEDKSLRGMDVYKIVDQWKVYPQDAWDEYETIQRYKLYTEEELEERAANALKEARKEELLDTGLDRIESTETDVEDLILIMADIVGSDEVVEEV